MGNLKDKILQVEDRTIEELFIPEWDFSVRIRTLSADEKDTVEKIIIPDKDGNLQYTDRADTLRARIAQFVLVNEDGSQVFDDSEESLKLLGQKSGLALGRIMSHVLEKNDFDDEKIKELAGNSSSGQLENSPSN